MHHISWKQLPIRCRDAARSLSLRLDGKHRNAPVLSLITLLMLPPPSVKVPPEL